MLYLIATPIGNLKDITLRSLEILQSVDSIICEDSRRTGLLLNHYQIKKPLIVLNDYNEQQMFSRVIDLLNQGQNIALVSDAGTPLVSDPGYKLVRECIKEAIGIDSLPGPSSVITALTLSGLPPDKFLFVKKNYIPDFLVEFNDGSKEIHETKGLPLLFLLSTKLKKISAEEYCRKMGWKYKFITKDKEVFYKNNFLSSTLGKIQDIKK